MLAQGHSVPFLTRGEKKDHKHCTEKGEWENQTSPREFLLLGFGKARLQVPLFLLFLLVCAETVLGNIFIVLAATRQHLHSPMYFFLVNLSSLEICYASINLPRLLANFLTGGRTTSAQDCMAELYFFASLAVSECHLLATMSYNQDTSSVYLLPGTSPLRNLNKIFFFYTILTPLVNPLSLRNREVKQALRKALRKAVACTESAH
ncbi:LOW QUALITY PROTEIN: olfactory receptor 8G50-like [Phoenicopterus ruber ruber]